MNLKKVKELVMEKLIGDKTGHSFDHIQRVLDLSLYFAKTLNANEYFVTLIALLHFVYYYMLVVF